eukprot:comp18007_c2_seq1/m.18450 comp18007_c2_seq1/g.18450  ORF comp18007_c2_seq1/g.18450 comp18007_c2_seq1/m.18450 type:complete len:172 (-) comp18007_c2_seq1:36-551(-)
MAAAQATFGVAVGEQIEDANQTGVAPWAVAAVVSALVGVAVLASACLVLAHVPNRRRERRALLYKFEYGVYVDKKKGPLRLDQLILEAIAESRRPAPKKEKKSSLDRLRLGPKAVIVDKNDKHKARTASLRNEMAHTPLSASIVPVATPCAPPSGSHFFFDLPDHAGHTAP